MANIQITHQIHHEVINDLQNTLKYPKHDMNNKNADYFLALHVLCNSDEKKQSSWRAQEFPCAQKPGLIPCFLS